jgi:phage FluMu gp28-like protein
MAAVDLLNYQKKFLQDPSRHVILMWSRGARKTFTTTLKLVLDCFEKDAKGERTDWVILSRGDRQALEAIQMARRHCEVILRDFGSRQSTFVSEDGLRRYTQHEIRFPCGSRIIALPANPDTARGYSANTLLDEFSIHEKSVEIWRAVYPILRGRYKVFVASTPKGGRNQMFYQLVHDTSGLWSKHIVDVHAAVAQGLPLNIEEEKAGIKDPDGWRQEYELQWLDEVSAWLPFDLILSAEHYECGNPADYMGGPCYVGVDVARHRNLWAAWILERVGDVFWTREIITLDSNAGFEEHRHTLSKIMQQYRVVKLSIDSTGMGEEAEWAEKKWGSRVDAVNFTQGSKHRMAGIGKMAFERNRIRIPLEDQDVRDDLYSLRKFDGVVPRFDTEKGASAVGSHADRAWALFLALSSAEENDGPRIITSSGQTAADVYQAQMRSLIASSSGR